MTAWSALGVVLAVSLVAIAIDLLLSPGLSIRTLLNIEHARATAPRYRGRQQLRQHARSIAARAVGNAPVSRRVRRQAARDLARNITR